ncbi:hypothetical protein BC829DRAFT_378414 [Chytridium lagenaria]|nr:hypothetical protein BC829DRAFT_378414 [Chytridium lagenaria]
MLYRSTIILFLLLAAASIVVHAQTADEERSPTVQVIVESTEIILGPSPVTTRRINGCLYQSFSMSDSDPVPKCACPAVQTFFNCAQKKGDCPALLEDIKKEASACQYQVLWIIAHMC